MDNNIFNLNGFNSLNTYSFDTGQNGQLQGAGGGGGFSQLGGSNLFSQGEQITQLASSLNSTPGSSLR